MKELKDKGITVISMQDLLAWKRGEKNIPPRCAVITFDDGWKSQYEVAWPIMKNTAIPSHCSSTPKACAGALSAEEKRSPGSNSPICATTALIFRRTRRRTRTCAKGTTSLVIEPGGKRGRKKLTGADYEKWIQNEVVGCKELLEQRLGIKVNCFAVPFGNYNEHVKELARNAGYEAMFTVYGQPITFTSPMDAIGRYAIEANKPKVFADAVSMIGASSGGGTAVAEVGAKDLTTQPADGETVRTALPLIKSEPEQHRADRARQCANAGERPGPCSG